MSIINELLDITKRELATLKLREFFLEQDLFKCYECNRLSESGRLLFGTLFLNCIKSNDIISVPIEKTSTGQKKYRVKEDR